MVSEIIAAVAVSGALIGAALNSIRAWYQAPEAEGFSKKKFVGALISGGMAALALINFSQLAALAAEGYIALFITNALVGVGASTLIHKSHEDEVKTPA